MRGAGGLLEISQMGALIRTNNPVIGILLCWLLRRILEGLEVDQLSECYYIRSGRSDIRDSGPRTPYATSSGFRAEGIKR
jgi:hypothetical protein